MGGSSMAELIGWATASSRFAVGTGRLLEWRRSKLRRFPTGRSRGCWLRSRRLEPRINLFLPGRAAKGKLVVNERFLHAEFVQAVRQEGQPTKLRIGSKSQDEAEIVD